MRTKPNPSPGKVISLRGYRRKEAAPPSAKGGGGRRIRVHWLRFAVAATFLYVLVSFVGQQMTFFELTEQRNQLEREKENLRREQALLQEHIERLQTEGYIIGEARNRFGMAHPNEIRYIVVDETVDEGERDSWP